MNKMQARVSYSERIVMSRNLIQRRKEKLLGGIV